MKNINQYTIISDILSSIQEGAGLYSFTFEKEMFKKVLKRNHFQDDVIDVMFNTSIETDYLTCTVHDTKLVKFKIDFAISNFQTSENPFFKFVSGTYLDAIYNVVFVKEYSSDNRDYILKSFEEAIKSRDVFDVLKDHKVLLLCFYTNDNEFSFYRYDGCFYKVEPIEGV